MKKDILWNSLGTTAWSFTSLILLIVVTRVNGIVESGVFSFAFAFGMIMYTVGCYGGRVFQVSDRLSNFSTDTYISLRLATSLLIIPILTILFISLNQYSLQESTILSVLVCHRVFDAISDVFYGILQKNNKLYYSGISLFYKSLLSTIAFIVIDITTHNLLLSSLSLPLLSLAFLVFYDIPHSNAVEKFKIHFELRQIKKIVLSTFLPFSIIIMGLVYANIARYFIEIYHPELQGYFGILIMPLSLIILMFSFILVPAIIKLTHEYYSTNHTSLHRSIKRISGVVALATLLCIIVTYLVGVPVLNLLFKADFSSYVPELILIIFVGFLLSITSLFNNIAIIARKLRYTFTLYLFSNVALIILCAFVVDDQEISGAVVSYTVISIIQTLGMYFYYLHLTNNHRLSKK